MQPAEPTVTDFDDQYPESYAAAWKEKNDIYKQLGAGEIYPMTNEQMHGVKDNELSFSPPEGYTVTSFTYRELGVLYRGAVTVEDAILQIGSGLDTWDDLDDIGGVIEVKGRGPNGELGQWLLDLPRHLELDWC